MTCMVRFRWRHGGEVGMAKAENRAWARTDDPPLVRLTPRHLTYEFSRADASRNSIFHNRHAPISLGDSLPNG